MNAHPRHPAARAAIAACIVGCAVAGCQAPPPKPVVAERARFYLESADDTGRLVVLPRSGVQIVIAPNPVFTEYDLRKVELTRIKQGECLVFEFTPAASRDLRKLTAANPGRRLVLLLGDVAFGARVIGEPLTNGVLFMFVETPDDALPALVDSLNETCAALPRTPARR